MPSVTPQPEPSLGWAAIDWIEYYLVHGPGDVQGQPIELDDEFAAFIVKAYRVRPEDGSKIVRRGFLSRAKGRSKSGLAGQIECFEALGPCRFDHWAEAGEVSDWGYEYEEGEPVGRPLGYVEILNVATEEGQAGNTYDGVYYALNPDTCSPQLLQDFGPIDVGLTRINLPDKRGFIEPVSASNESKDGGKSTFIIADETHLWIPPVNGGSFKLGKMHQTMVRNLFKRKLASGWMLETSTMYAAGEKSVAEGTHDYAKSGKAGGKLLFDHRQASDKWNLEDRPERIAALREAYGPASDWMDLESIADYWDDPQASHAEFCRFFLNQPVPLVEPVPAVVDLGIWRSCADPKSRIVGKAVFAVEVSSGGQWASISVCGRNSDGNYHVELLHPDERVRTSWVLPELKRLNEKWKPIGFVVDPRSGTGALAIDMEREGLPLIKIDSSGRSAALATLISKVVDEKLVVHLGQYALTSSLEGATKRFVGAEGAEQLDRKTPKVDLTPIVSAHFALWGLVVHESKYVDAMACIW